MLISLDYNIFRMIRVLFVVYIVRFIMYFRHYFILPIAKAKESMTIAILS